MQKIISINPATEDINGEFDSFSEERIDLAIKKSRTAFSGWKKISISDRSEYLENAAKVLLKRKNELGKLITSEMGKVKKESISEIEKCAWVLEYFAENTSEFLEREIIETDANKSCIKFEPYGTILSIMPWNFPFWQAIRFAAPALAGGNVILLKHSSYVPLCAIELERVFLDAGFPEGVYQTLLIDGKTTSELICRNEINGVSMTGSVSTGMKVAETCGKNLKKLVLELGGSDPFIVLADADIDKAANIAVEARFRNSGQSCINAKRFIVDESIVQEFTSMFVENTRKLKIGDPMDGNTDIGPLVREDQIKILENQSNDALLKGAKVMLEGERVDKKGFFYSPVILTDVTKDMLVMKEETFGPVAPILSVKDEYEAIKIANDSEFGLGASIWSENIENALLLGNNIEAGMVFINNLARSDPRLPFGGVKKSGIGRELSKFGLYEFMRTKSISIY